MYFPPEHFLIFILFLLFLFQFPNNFRLDYALSREMTNKAGGKMYIQDKVEEYADEVFQRMDKGAHMYFCGLKVNKETKNHYLLYVLVSFSITMNENYLI